MISKTIFTTVGFRYRSRLAPPMTARITTNGSSRRLTLWSPLRYPLLPFKLTDIGEGIKEVTVKQCFVKPNQTVSQFDDVCEVESDKASVTITSRFDGLVKNVYIAEGDVIPVGWTLLDVETDAETEAAVRVEETVAAVSEDGRGHETVEKVAYTRPETQTAAPAAPTAPTAEATEERGRKALATPAVRRIAKEYDVDVNAIRGSGKEGRVVKEDVLAHLGRPSAAEPAAPGEAGSVPITGYRKVMFRTMTESNRIPTLTLSEEYDVTELETLRKELKKHLEGEGVKLTLLAFLVKAVSLGLEKYPVLNATLEGETIRYMPSHNIGIAVDTEAGLVVPNIKNARRLSVRAIAKEVQRLQLLAAANKLSLADTANGTFTISNIGSIAGTVVKPLILPPQVAIVGIGRIRAVPRYNNEGDAEKRSVVNASWAADHRIIDGGTVARFSNVVKRYLEKPGMLTVDS